jgi:SAM-dependent methyltransferase
MTIPTSHNGSWPHAFINAYWISRSGLISCLRPALSQLPLGAVLDIGCGKSPYRTIVPHTTYIGIDVHISGHDHRKSRISAYYDGNKLPFSDESINTCLCLQVLEHAINHTCMISEMHRVLQNNGSLVISVPFAWPEHERPYDFRRFSKIGLCTMLQDHGFDIHCCSVTAPGLLALTQISIAWFCTDILRDNRFLVRALTPAIFGPIQLFARMLSWALPQDSCLYLDEVIVARKRPKT